MGSVTDQSGHRFRCEWGAAGIAALADCAVLVIVDVLSFSTSTTIAVAGGAQVLPLRMSDDAAAARARGAVLAGDRSWTLRPSSLVDIEPGVLLGLPSPNGATLCREAALGAARVFVGCLRNATAVARAALKVDGPVGVIAAGERWGVREGPLRPAVEDQLGAGAILSALDDLAPGELSMEARVAVSAFRTLRHELAPVLRRCSSGRELIAGGHAGDVELAAELDAAKVAPELHDGILG